MDCFELRVTIVNTNTIVESHCMTTCFHKPLPTFALLTVSDTLKLFTLRKVLINQLQI